MYKIESNNDLLKWAKDVNTSNCNIPDLQDVFVRSTMNELKQYFIDSQQNDKELIVFSISKCMGSSTLLEFITVYSRHKAELYIESEGHELDKKYADLAHARQDFETEKEQLTATIKALHSQNQALDRDNDSMTAEVSKYYVHNLELQANIEELQAELDKQRAFESHIKELLNS